MDRGTLIRTIVLIGALINQMLVTFNLEPFPMDETVGYEVISTIFTVIISLITWFKNNYLTLRGKRQLEVLQREGLTDVRE